MPPLKRPNRNTLVNQTPPPPPPQFDVAMFQAAVTATVTPTMKHMNSGGANVAGTGTNSNHSDSKCVHGSVPTKSSPTANPGPLMRLG